MHASRAAGPGIDFAGHGRLFDRPDPRRLDLRASITSVPREWLVRLTHQRSSVALHAIVDVSASMRVGERDDDRDARPDKLDVAIDFVTALGRSAFLSGDSAGLLAFDERARDDLLLPARGGRGAGALMAETLEACRSTSARAGDGSALIDCARQLSGSSALVFIVSDFHWPLEVLAPALEALGTARVVPLVVRDRAELAPPSGDGWLGVVDAESGRRRSLWLRESTRRRWREALVAREAAIDAAFVERDLRPLRLVDRFDADALTRHFLENTV